jgi:hypothetical protein
MASSRSRTLLYKIAADEVDFKRGVQSAERDLGHLESRGTASLNNLKKVALGTSLAIGGGLVALGKSSVQAAIESEKSNARLQAQLKALGISYKAHEDQISRVIQKQSQLAALDDEDLADSFTAIVRVVGDVNKALKLNALAADFARAKHIDVAKAGELVGKVAGGNTGILSRYGIVLEKNATAQQAIAALQEKFAGQAEAYGKTTAGSVERAGVAWENLRENLGAKLAPVLGTVANAFSNLINEISTGEGPGKVIRGVFDSLGVAIGGFVTQVKNGTGPGGALRDVIVDLAKATGTTVKFFDHNRTALSALTTVVGAATAGFVAFKAATAITAAIAAVSGGVTGLTGAFTALRVAMLANPFVAAATAIAALGAALVIAYKKSDTFRAAVDASFNAVRSTIKAVANTFLGFLTTWLGGMQKVVELASHIPVVGGKFKGLAEDIKHTRERLDGWREGLQEADDQGRKYSLQSVRTQNSQTRDSFDKLRHDANANLDDITRTAKTRAQQIRETLGTNSAEGRAAMARNFQAAANAVQAQMNRAGGATKRGTEVMNGYIRQALAQYGITGRAATNYMRGNGVGTFGENERAAGSGHARGGFAKAGGGWIGSQGERGQDMVPIVVGRGEAVLNRHQQRALEADTYPGYLDDLFGQIQTPHYMAKGGYASGGTVTGDTDYGPAMASALNALARAAGTSIYVQSGGRSLGEQAALVRQKGLYSASNPTGAAAPSPNAPHVRGIAADITPGRSVLGALAGRFGLGFPLPSEPWHIQLASGNAGGPGMASVAPLKRVRFPGGMGALSAIGQAGLDAVRRGGQALLNRAVSTSFGGDASSAPVAPGWAGSYGKAQIANLWVRAGGDPKMANLMAAIALAESGGRAGIVNSIGATGLWQIHPGGSQYLNPLTNARTAIMKLRTQGLRAWEAYTNGSYRQFLARGGFAGRRKMGLGGIVGNKRSTNYAIWTNALRHVNPRPAVRVTMPTRVGGGLDDHTIAGLPAYLDKQFQHQTDIALSHAAAALALAELNNNTQAQIDALGREAATWKQRLARAQAQHHTGAVAEAATALAGINGQISDLRQSMQVAVPSFLDFLDANTIRAQVDTPNDKSDDILQAQTRVNYFQQQYNQAVASQSASGISEFGQELLSAREALAQLQESTDTNTAAQEAAAAAQEEQNRILQEHTQALQDLKDEIKRQTDFAASVQNTSEFQLRKALADVISGEIGGRTTRRSYTPGTGVQVAY